MPSCATIDDKKTIRDIITKPTWEGYKNTIVRRWTETTDNRIVDKDGKEFVYYPLKNLHSFRDEINYEGIRPKMSGNFFVCGKLKNNSDDKLYSLKVSLQDAGLSARKRKQFKFFMKLHMSLKNQRNVSAHAATGDRYDAAVIKHAIEEYIAMARYLRIGTS